MERRITKSAVALGLAMFMLGGVAGFFAGYPVGRGATGVGLTEKGGMLIQDVQDEGISMTSVAIPLSSPGISPMALEAQQVTATVTPVDAEDAVLDWSLAWKSGASGQWGNGKDVTEYVTVTPTEDGALTANVQCLQAFGEQIVITAAIRGNASVKGTSTIDYEKRISSLNVYYYKDANSLLNQSTSTNVAVAPTSPKTITIYIPDITSIGTDLWSKTIISLARTYSTTGSVTTTGKISYQYYILGPRFTSESELLDTDSFNNGTDGHIGKNVISGNPAKVDISISTYNLLAHFFHSDPVRVKTIGQDVNTPPSDLTRLTEVYDWLSSGRCTFSLEYSIIKGNYQETFNLNFQIKVAQSS